MKYDNIGVYKITNIINNKVYVGSTKRSFYKRFNEHLKSLKNNIHENSYLQNSYNKYGVESFKFEILEICSIDKCEEREQYFTDTFKSFDKKNGYNIRSIVSSNIGIKRSKETCLKISISKKGKASWNKGIPILDHVKKAIIKANTGRKRPQSEKDQISISTKGRILSQATKDKISKSHTGRIHTEEARKNMGQSNNIEVYQYTENMVFINKFKSISSASRETTTNRSSIYNCLKGKQKIANNYIWKAKEVSVG